MDRNRLQETSGIGIGSSLQIALVALVLTIAITGQIAGDGESNWFEGVQLLAVYLILAVMFYYLPRHEQIAS
ncbi:MAG: hypothetical protein JO182_01650 [Acidobacteriaceae bacterium]|nr:hypothetical protein [Acidobacteriaceae bacterium]